MPPREEQARGNAGLVHRSVTGAVASTPPPHGAAPPHVASPEDRRLRALAEYSGDPWTPENEYFAHAEAFMDASWRDVIWPLIGDSDFRMVIDLAAGHGRNSEKLAAVAGSILILDIQPGNVARCRARFGHDARFSFAVNNGYDLQPAPAESATLVYCFDAMVHFDGDVIRSYLRDTMRVLVPGGRAFLHHSNYTGGDDWRRNPSARNFMSQAFFAHYARREGLTVLRQRPLDWDGHAELDCLTLLEKPRAPREDEALR